MTREASIIKTIKDNAMLAVNPQWCPGVHLPGEHRYTDPTGWETQQNAGDPGEYMRVRSRYIHTFFTPLIGSFFSGGGITIQAEGTYRNELFN